MPIKKAIFKTYALFADCMSEINNTQVDDAHDIDIVMYLYNLIFIQYNLIFVLMIIILSRSILNKK